MEIYDENIAAEQYAGVNDRRSELEKLGAGAMNNRRALKDIRNLMGAPPISRAVTKRGLQDENALINQKNPNVSHRPITRKFAATLKSQAASSQGPRKVVPPPASGGTSIAIYEDPCESEETKKPPVDEELAEIDMEDSAADQPVVDIDLVDAENPLAVVDYVREIYSFYRESEASSCVSPNYMSIQVDINEKMRAILIDWLIEVHHKFDMLDETLFLMVNIIDRFLAKQSVARKKLQLVGVTAMLLACKYEEVSVPVVEDLVVICDRAYTKSDILEMERLIVNTLQFNISVPTSYVFMRRFLKAAESDRELEIQSFYIIELSMVEYEMLKFPPSLLAAAAIYTAQSSLRRFSIWTRTSELHTGYSEEQLLECSKKMVDFHQKAGTGKLTGVHRKYNTFKFEYAAAKSEPALFLLDRKP